MGPEPISRIFLMSSRFGTRAGPVRTKKQNLPKVTPSNGSVQWPSQKKLVSTRQFLGDDRLNWLVFGSGERDTGEAAGLHLGQRRTFVGGASIGGGQTAGAASQLTVGFQNSAGGLL